MAEPPVAVVGSGNIVGTNFTNVGNQTVHYHIYPHEQRIFTLESRVSFDALLNSEARYPPPKCHPATRKEAQKVVKNWVCRKGEGSEKGIMWMNGAPGVGKSAIAQTVCEELCGDDGSKSWLSRIIYRDQYIDACFFFARGFENRERVSFFPATVAFQLCRSRGSCRTTIDKVIESRPEILGQDFPSQFRHLLMQAAKTLGFLQGPLTIVIDGLDECNSAPDQVALLELIVEAVKAGNMRFFIASRPEQHIYAFFHRWDVSQHTWQVRLDEETFNTSQDIKVFLREEFARIRQERPEACLCLPDGQDWPGDPVIDYLTVNSDSQFMFPTLAIGFIDTPYFPPDKQLQILLEAPPSHAFSALDSLYHKILSRCPPVELTSGQDDLRQYKEVVMGVLRVIIAWSGNPLTAAQIATFLDKPVNVVQTVVRGPMRALFKFHTPHPESPITLCHKSLRDYLLNQKRSEGFFIASAEEDDLFITLLTHTTPPPSSMPMSSPSLLMDVLAAILWGRYYWPTSMRHIAACLGVDPIVVEHVVISRPTSVLFKVFEGRICACKNSLEGFLRDANRSGAFFISERRMDALLIRFLSHLPPPSPPYTYSKSFLLDVFAIISAGYAGTLANIAALLEVDTSIVEHVVQIGTSRILFEEMDQNLTPYFRSNGDFQNFLADPHRSNEFFVSENRLDPVFSRILSRQPLSNPSPPSYRDTLMDVVTVVVALEGKSRIQQIASLFHVDDTLVEGIVTSGPTKPLFCMTEDGLTFSVRSFGDYLQNGTRSGAFFVSDTKLDSLFIQSLSHLVSAPSSYSQSVLVDILAVVLWTTASETVEHISAFLEVDRDAVKNVVEVGVVQCLFAADENNRVTLSNWRVEKFLADAERSREFFVSDSRLDPIFLQILSRETPPDPSPSSYREILMDVMTAILAFEGKLKIEDIVSLLNIDGTLVEGVVKSGPTNVFFCGGKSYPDRDHICFSTRLLKPFLQDATRSKEFFISQSGVDALFIRILSRGPVSGPSILHSREHMMDVLTLFIGYPRGKNISTILHFFNSVSSILDDFYGPIWVLFCRSNFSDDATFSSPSFVSFLKDMNRSGEFCITERRIDTFFTKVFSTPPPSNPSLSYSKTLLMDVLTVIVSFPYGLTIPRIASALGVDSEVIKSVVLGPLEPFLEEGLDTKIIDQPFIDFLTNAEGSGEFFVSSEGIDTLFTRILSHQPQSRDALMGVLTILSDCTDLHDVAWSPSQLASFMDVSLELVDDVINVGLSYLLFDSLKWDGFGLSTPLLVPFLKDDKRSAEFCISHKSLDHFFSRILSSPGPPSPLGSSAYTWNTVLKDVLTITLLVPEGISVPEIGAALGISPSVVESVVQVGPATTLFRYGVTYGSKYSFSTASVVPFLRDGERSVDFYISDAVVDALFIRILSLPPPSHLSHSSFKDVLLDVMATILASPEPCTVAQIAALLNIDRSLVEGVVKVIPASVFFGVEKETLKVTISSPLLIPFLHDAHRSGEFFIPPIMFRDDIPKPWLHHPSTLVDEFGDGGREDEMKGKLSLSAPHRSGSLYTEDKATGSIGAKRPKERFKKFTFWTLGEEYE